MRSMYRRLRERAVYKPRAKTHGAGKSWSVITTPEQQAAADKKARDLKARSTKLANKQNNKQRKRAKVCDLTCPPVPLVLRGFPETTPSPPPKPILSKKDLED